MRIYFFWCLVCFLALMVGGGVAAFVVFNLIAEAILVSLLCGLVLLWIRG